MTCSAPFVFNQQDKPIITLLQVHRLGAGLRMSSVTWCLIQARRTHRPSRTRCHALLCRPAYFSWIQSDMQHTPETEEQLVSCQLQEKQCFEFQAGNQVPKLGALNMKPTWKTHASSFKSCNMPKQQIVLKTYQHSGGPPAGAPLKGLLPEILLHASLAQANSPRMAAK